MLAICGQELVQFCAASHDAFPHLPYPSGKHGSGSDLFGKTRDLFGKTRDALRPTCMSH